MKKKNDPAFLFYPNEFESHVKFLNHKQLGMFLRLIITIHQHGHLSMDDMIYIIGEKDEKVFSKFLKDENGLYYSEWLEDRLNERKVFTESRRKNIQKRYEKSTSVDTYVDTSVLHMVNANENANTNEIEIENKSLKGKKYKSEDFAELPEQYIQSSIERLSIQKNISVNALQVSKMWSIFKSQNLAGDKWYNSEADVYRHFSNWIKNQTFNETDKRTSKTGRNSGTYELLEKLRQEHGGNFG